MTSQAWPSQYGYRMVDQGSLTNRVGGIMEGMSMVDDLTSGQEAAVAIFTGAAGAPIAAGLVWALFHGPYCEGFMGGPQECVITFSGESRSWADLAASPESIVIGFILGGLAYAVLEFPQVGCTAGGGRVAQRALTNHLYVVRWPRSRNCAPRSIPTALIGSDLLGPTWSAYASAKVV